MDDLRHYASAPVQLDARVTTHGEVGLKPSGLWVSVGSAWLDWCRSEDFRSDIEWFEHEVKVSTEANILHVSDCLALDDFTAKYGRQISPQWDTRYIDWGRAAAEYDGIVIAPYQWPSRHKHLWYYGWDCASGCIWNPSVVSLGEAAEVSFEKQGADR